jgi:hypothetical protein
MLLQHHDEQLGFDDLAGKEQFHVDVPICFIWPPPA